MLCVHGLPSGYEIPTQKDCDKCHHGGADKLLGIEAVALALPDAAGETLTALAKDGWLSDPPADTSKSLPEDGTGKAAAALGYLHANCGMPCHSSVIQKYPGALRITPGAHDQSLLWLLAHLRGQYQMPPLVSHLVDDVGTQRLADWIDALPQ